MPAGSRPPSDRDLTRRLRDRFGHRDFRPGQRETIRALLAGRDVLAVLPTGSGKSLLYQLPAGLLPGVTVVISPLIALMTDQVESLAELGIRAAMASSTRTARENAAALEDAAAGRVRLLYVTPERFDDADFTGRLAAADVSLLVVDEAHCISDWGHSFRPSYLELADVAARLGRPPLLALTATATPWVRDDIVDRLRLRDHVVVVRGNDRPNLFYEVVRVEEEAGDRRVLERLLGGEGDGLPDAVAGATAGSGIVYVATVAAARETAAWLTGWGIPADAYHGRLRKAERERVQDDFMDGRLRVIAATNAFGLGVDKPDVRFVVHRDVPASVEAYMQESGRAGRDGDPARCTLIYRPGDLARAAFLGGTARIDGEDVERVRDALQAGPAGRRDLAERSGVGRAVLGRLLPVLEEAGAVVERRRRLELRDADLATDAVVAREERRREYEASRVDMMRAYAETGGCRREFLLNYVGEDFDADGCRMCDNHVRGLVAEADDAAPWGVGDRVRHETFGAGAVQSVDAEKVTVLFDEGGYKSLALELVEEGGLLQAETV